MRVTCSSACSNKFYLLQLACFACAPSHPYTVHPVLVSYTCRCYIQRRTQAERLQYTGSLYKLAAYPLTRVVHPVRVLYTSRQIKHTQMISTVDYSASFVNTSWFLQAEGDLRQKTVALQKEKEIMAKVPVADNDLLTLNIGGSIQVTKRSTLTQVALTSAHSFISDLCGSACLAGQVIMLRC